MFHRGALQLTQNIGYHIWFLSPTFPFTVLMMIFYVISQITLVLLLKDSGDPMFLEGLFQGLMVTLTLLITGYILHKRDVKRFLAERKSELKEQ